MKHIVGIVGVIVVVIAVSWASYQFNRWWNYTWSYESQVTDTICEMVKSEHLKKPEKCE